MSQACPATSRCRLVTAVLSASSALLLLLGCTGGLDPSIEELRPPAIVPMAPIETCVAPGTAAVLVLSTTGTKVTLDEPTTIPINRIDVVGQVTGLPAGESVLVALVPDDTDCPVSSITVAAVGAGGDFTARLDVGMLRRFRVVAFASAATTGMIRCLSATDCLETTGPAISGISDALLVRIE
jgi:hypothetical protein